MWRNAFLCKKEIIYVISTQDIHFFDDDLCSGFCHVIVKIFSFVISFMIKSEGGSLKSFQEFYSSSKEGSWNREVLHIRRVAVRCWFDFIKDQITRTTSSISWLVSTQKKRTLNWSVKRERPLSSILSIKKAIFEFLRPKTFVSFRCLWHSRCSFS